MNYLSRNIVYLNSAERKAALNIIKSDRMEKILLGQLDIETLRIRAQSKGMFLRAIELNNLVKKFSKSSRKLKISLKGTKDIYVLNKYTVDNNCIRDCEFKPSPDKDVDFSQGYSETIELSPYSVQLLVFKKKPPEPVAAAVVPIVAQKSAPALPTGRPAAKDQVTAPAQPPAVLTGAGQVTAATPVTPVSADKFEVAPKKEKTEEKVIPQEEKSAESK